MTIHYRILTPVQKDGHPYHPDGELTYLEEFDAAKIAEFLADGTAEECEGPVPDVPPPAEPAAPEPTIETPAELPAEYHLEWRGEGDPPPDSWAYIWQHQGAQEPPATEAPSEVQGAPAEAAVSEVPKADDEGGSAWQP